MESWQELLRKRSVASLEALVARFGAEHFPDLERLRQAAENFEFRISPAMVELITSPGDPIWRQYVPDLQELGDVLPPNRVPRGRDELDHGGRDARSEEHTSELQSLAYLVFPLLLEKKK